METQDKAWLVSEGGVDKGKRFSLSGSALKIGRIPGQNQIVLEDSEISRFHATILVSSSGEFRLQDSSANGTYVNGQRVETALLQSGDRIRFGLNQTNTFIFEAPEIEKPKDSSDGHGTMLAQAVAARRRQTV